MGRGLIRIATAEYGWREVGPSAVSSACKIFLPGDEFTHEQVLGYE